MDCEYRVFHPSKGEIWVDAHAVPVTEPDRKITYYAFIRDVTDRNGWSRASVSEATRTRIR